MLSGNGPPLPRHSLQPVETLVSSHPDDPVGPEADAVVAASRNRRLLHGAIQGGLARILGFAGPLLIIPVSTRALGSANYGIYVLATVAQALLPALELGLGLALITRLAEPLALHDHARAHRIASSVLIAQAILAIAWLPLLIAGSLLIPWSGLLALDTVHAHILAQCLVVVSLGFAIGVPSNFAFRVLFAEQRTSTYWAWQAASSLAVITTALTALTLAPDVRWLVTASFVTPSVVAAVATLQLFRTRPSWRPTRHAWSMKELRAVLRLGPTLSVAALLTAAFQQVDRVLVSIFLGPAAVGTYGITARLASVPQQLGSMMLLPLWPACGEALARGDRLWLRRTMVRLEAIMLALGVALVFGFWLLGDDVLAIFAGTDFQTTAALRISLALAVAGGLCVIPLGMLFNAAGIRLYLLSIPVASILTATGVGLTLVSSFDEVGIALGMVAGWWLAAVLPGLGLATWLIHRVKPASLTEHTDP